MKIAYCIICHRYSPIIKECVDILYKDNDIYIHVDKKSDINTFEDLKDKAIFIDKREDIKWGHISQIYATLNLLNATKIKDYDYIFLLSGDCLPLKNSDEIKKFLKINKGKEFIGIQKLSIKERANIENRLKFNYSNRHWKKNKSVIEKFINKIQEIFGLYHLNENFEEIVDLQKGLNWFGITGELREYILEYLENNNNFLLSFEKTYCADEIFFQTIVWNSPYKKNIYLINQCVSDNEMALRYIDWSDPEEFPKTLNEDDFCKIDKSKFLFARKFQDTLNIEKFNQFIDRV